jgi:hypothetical protein
MRANAKSRCLIYVSIRQHTSAYVSIREDIYHTSAYVRIREDIYQPTLSVWSSEEQRRAVAVCTCIRQHTSAHVSIRQHTSAYVRTRQHTAYVSISATAESLCLIYVRMRPHTSAYVSIAKSRCLIYLQHPSS